MKKLIVVIAIMALTLFAWGFFAPAQPQGPASEEKPTFYRLVPGTYVNPWPRFIITYPKDWVERRLDPQMTFRASAPGPAPYPTLIVAPFASPSFSLEEFADTLANALGAMSTDVTVVSDKPSQLRDGTPTREVEIHMLLNGIPEDVMNLVARKGDLWVNWVVKSRNGRIGPDLKAILYSIEFEPDKDRPVKVPPDVQEFLDNWRNDIVSHDLVRVMSYYSNRYLESGERKREVERFTSGVASPGKKPTFLRWAIGSVTSCQVVITDFEEAGDRTYLAGFAIVNGLKYMIRGTSIIKENGEWKWYGNQRDVSP